MSALKPCPCGMVPTELHVTSHEGDQPKWAMASGNCCNEWNVEFRNEWARIGATKCSENAKRAWNSAPRAQPTAAPSGQKAAQPNAALSENTKDNQ